MGVMLYAVAIAIQGPYYLSFTAGDVIKYTETFSVTETVGTKSFSAEATREQTLVVKKWDRNRATLDVKYTEPLTRGASGSASLAASLKSWLFREDGEEFVDQRGHLKRAGFPEGNRPFFGFNVPGHRDRLPAEWKVKLLPPIGLDKPIEFKYAPLNASGLLGISFAGTFKDKEVEVKCDGTVHFDSGKVASARMTSRVTDSDGTIEFLYSAIRRQ